MNEENWVTVPEQHIYRLCRRLVTIGLEEEDFEAWWERNRKDLYCYQPSGLFESAEMTDAIVMEIFGAPPPWRLMEIFGGAPPVAPDVKEMEED